MELKQYLSLLKKRILIVVILALLTGVTAFLLSFFKPVSYDASVSFAVNRINVKETEDYQYDGYYAIQASDLVSQTVVSWFATPSVVLEIYEKANIDPQYDSLEQFATFFNTKKYSGQNIGVKFNEKEEAKARAISTATINVISSKVKALNKNADSNSLFEAVASPPVIVENKANVILNTIIGFIAGLAIGFYLVYVIHYFKEEKTENIQTCE